MNLKTTKRLFVFAACALTVAAGVAQTTQPEKLTPEVELELTSELQATHRGDYNFVNLLKLGATLPITSHLRVEAAALSTCMTADWCIGSELQTFSNLDAGRVPFALSVMGIGYAPNDRHSLFVGIRNMNEDYFASDLTAFYTSSSCGIYPTISANMPIANYPMASVGIHYRYEREIRRAKTEDTDVFALQASLYNGMGSDEIAGCRNVFRVCPQSDGVFALAQAEYQHAGSSYFVGACGRNAEIDGYASRQWTSALWAYAEQRLNDRLSLIAGYSHAFGAARLCTDFVGVGAKYDWARCEMGVFSNYAHFVEGGECATEVTCKVKLSPHIYVQPAAHLIFSPSLDNPGQRVTQLSGILRMGLSF